jgi:predicted acyltransferase
MGLETSTNGSAAPPGQRLVSLDAYRGFTMLAMISAGLGMAHLQNDPTWGWLADQLDHREWIGCTAWDLIQPSFMFIVGVAMPFSFAQRRRRGDSWALQFGHALRRAMLLILIGVFLDSVSEGKLYVQFIRVLQQIAIGYVLAFLVLHLSPVWQGLTAGLILGAHTAAFLWYGHAVGCWPWEEGYNLGTRLDEIIGLPVSGGGYATLNAVSSTATILFGVMCGELLQGPLSARRKLQILGLAGLGGLAGALVLLPIVPMIKRIWTASFTVYAGGWTCLLLLAFYGIVDVLGWRRWTFALVVVGMNSIAAYVAAGLLGPVIRRCLVPFVTEPLSHAPLAGPVVMALLVVLAEWGFCYWLYRQQIFFKL